MDKRTAAVLVAGIVVTLLLIPVSIYLAGIAIIIVVALVMSMMISQDTNFRPQVEARLREDAKAVILFNNGNSPALSIHAALVPMNIEFDVPSLGVDQSHEYLLPSMVSNVKAVVTYENEKGLKYSNSFPLSSSGEYDPLKPMIPIFGWK